MSVEEQVKSHIQELEAGVPVRFGEGCRHCNNSESFHVNEGRSRSFRLVDAAASAYFAPGSDMASV